LDNITRSLLDSGTLARYIRELSVTGLTSNPTIFEKAIGSGNTYDQQVAELAAKGNSIEEIFFACAISDLTRAADLFAEIHARTKRVDGWVSLEVSPLLANDTVGTVAQAVELHKRAGRPNLYIKVPGTPEGCPAIEELIFRGVPINVTLLFSAEQYLAAAEAYTRGIERRVAAGLDPFVCSVASKPAEHRRHCDGGTRLQVGARFLRDAALEGASCQGRHHAAGAVGFDRHQGSCAVAVPLLRCARCA
jgi:transaldolase